VIRRLDAPAALFPEKVHWHEFSINVVPILQRPQMRCASRP